ncbi:MAG: hypothetical protein LBD62_00260 [Candidatus Margulisbacteria bacterium]|jgi:hypothetical protein|nr:hypothetical protein [Candidatus Margulisiibacteriota bacterium]
MIDTKTFDCIKFKDGLQASLYKKTAGMTNDQYIEFTKSETRKYYASMRKSKER